MPRKYLIVFFFMAFVGARHAVPLQGLAFADSYTQDGQPCPPECVSDSMEIETYYPSPYGYYEELRGDKIIVGDSDNSWVNETDLPPKGTITFEPLSDDPDSSDGSLYEGSLYYQEGIGGTKGKFRFYDGLGWQDLGGGIPQGIIVMWAGTINSVPNGWALCDGTNGTPDLRDRFILGASVGENPGATGGANSYQLNINQLPSHNHAFTTSAAGGHSHGITLSYNGGNTFGCPSTPAWGATYNGNCSYSTGNTGSVSSHTHSGTTDSVGNGAAVDNRPAYYKLAFIMKL